MDYKKYSLEQLENWMHDAINGDASPHEIYSTIRAVVKENLDHHKEYHQKCLGLYELMSAHRPVKLQCDKDDPSPECVKAWDSFWENNEVESIRQEGGYEWTPEPKVSDKYETKNGVTYLEYIKAKIEVDSAWNDGWTKEHYQKIVDKYEKGIV